MTYEVGDYITAETGRYRTWRRVTKVERDTSGKVIVRSRDHWNYADHVLGHVPKQRAISITRSDGYAFTFLKLGSGYTIQAGCHRWAKFETARRRYKRVYSRYSWKPKETRIILDALEKLAITRKLLRRR